VRQERTRNPAQVGKADILHRRRNESSEEVARWFVGGYGILKTEHTEISRLISGKGRAALPEEKGIVPEGDTVPERNESMFAR
jgi:hypothetical protein